MTKVTFVEASKVVDKPSKVKTDIFYALINSNDILPSVCH